MDRDEDSVETDCEFEDPYEDDKMLLEDALLLVSAAGGEGVVTESISFEESKEVGGRGIVTTTGDSVVNPGLASSSSIPCPSCPLFRVWDTLLFLPSVTPVLLEDEDVTPTREGSTEVPEEEDAVSKVSIKASENTESSWVERRFTAEDEEYTGGNEGEEGLDGDKDDEGNFVDGVTEGLVGEEAGVIWEPWVVDVDLSWSSSKWCKDSSSLSEEGGGEAVASGGKENA